MNIPQAVYERVSAYQRAEMVWMDAHVRAQWPRFICALAERDGMLAHLLRVWVARYSGLEVVRGKNMSANTPTTGFRPGRAPHKQMIDSITTTIFKHQKNCRAVVTAAGEKTRPNCTDQCIVDRHTFELGVPF